ncbi:hypothetical protein B0H19DRAFT_1367026 [Mycena capillaripes]|nr:hypothetical protein B0H19DRAFT_1367026 [Mycena capillaripes]
MQKELCPPILPVSHTKVCTLHSICSCQPPIRVLSPTPIIPATCRRLSTMYPSKLALVILGAAVAYGYPAVSKNPESLALVVPQNVPRTIEDPRAATRVKADGQKRQIHNADYQANSPPPSPNPAAAQEASSPAPADPTAAAPSNTVAKDKRAEPSSKHGQGPIVSSPSSSHEKTSKDQLDVEGNDVKRQVHNADYQANSPPPSPTPAAAQKTSAPSPPPAAASPEPAPKDKRGETSVKHGPEPIVVPSPSSSRKKTVDGKEVEESSVKRQVHNADYQANSPPLTPAQESSPPSPPAAASPEPAPKDKRDKMSFPHGASPVVSSLSSTD